MIYIDNLKQHSRFRAYELLEKLGDDNPFKKFEGLTPHEFIKENFSSISSEVESLVNYLIKKIQDVVFIKYYVDKLQREYWFCLYDLGLDEDGERRYCIGGEPQTQTAISKELQAKTNLDTFPDNLQQFWSIHGLWYPVLNYGKDDFDLEVLATNFYLNDIDGEVPHYTLLTLAGNDLELDEWSALSHGICIDFDEEIEDEMEEEFEFDYFLEQHIKKGIYFTQTSTGDAILLVESYKEFSSLFYLCHDACSNFYDSFWDYMIEEIRYLY